MYQRILVPVDGSDPSNRGLDEALKLARTLGSRVRLLHVIDEPFMALGGESLVGAGGDLLTLVREAGASILEKAKERAAQADVVAETVLLDSFNGRVCDLVANEARDWGADLIVIGTHGRRGFGRALLGSDAEQILRISPTATLLVRADASLPSG